MVDITLLCTRNCLNSEHMVQNIQGKIYFSPVAGADPCMVRIGTGTPPFWQINHANSAYFRLVLGFLGLYQPPAPPPPFGSRAPLYTYPGSAPAWTMNSLTQQPTGNRMACNTNRFMRLFFCLKDQPWLQGWKLT